MKVQMNLEKCIDFLTASLYHRHVYLFSIYIPMSLMKSLYALVGTLLVAENAFAAATDLFGSSKANPLNNGGSDAYTTITNVVK